VLNLLTRWLFVEWQSTRLGILVSARRSRCARAMHPADKISNAIYSQVTVLWEQGTWGSIGQ
jgi:hypothetical protein